LPYPVPKWEGQF